MTPMLKLIFLYSLLLGAVGCKPEEPITPDPDPNPKDTVATVYRQLFKTAIPNAASGALVNEKIWIHQGNPIMATQDNQGKALIVCFEGATGHVKWSWAEDSGNCVGAGQFILSGDHIVFTLYWEDVVVVDANTGSTVWKTNIKNNSVPRISAFDGYIYYAIQKGNASTAYVIRSPLSNISWDTLAVIGTSPEGAKPILEPANRWISSSGDTLVYFQNRTYYNNGSKKYVALYALNLRTREIAWKQTNFCDGNISSVRAPYLYRSKLYFMGMGDLTCMNPETGEILWQRAVNETPGVWENFGSTDLVFWDNKMAFAPGNDILHCWDVNTGKTIWKNPNAGQAAEMMAWDGKIWYLSGDYIFNFSDGQQSYPNSGIYSGAIAVDSLSGRVFGLGATYLYGYEKKP